MQIIDRAIRAGRSMQSSQTGLVHYCHQSKDGKTHDTIPLLENLAFALALFRSRMAEQVLEGKAIVDQVLAFECEGNFPVYLHNFPLLEDPYHSLRLYPYLFWIAHDFAHVIGDLKQKISALLERIEEKYTRRDLPLWAQNRVNAFQGEVGDSPTAPHEWGEELISLQIAQKRRADIASRLADAQALWNPTLRLYTGFARQRHQMQFEPEKTIFDLFLACWSKQEVQLPSGRSPLLLRSAQIRPMTLWPLALKEKPIWVNFSPEAECPFYCAWQGTERTHTLALSKKHLQIEMDEAGDLLIQYPEELPDTEEKSFEVNLFLNHDPVHQIRVNGQRATVFQQGDEVEILSKDVRIILSFSSEEGAFCGHILKGNRPSQHALIGEDSFAAFDWRIAIRTVRRERGATMRVRALLVSEQGSRQPLPLHASHYQHRELHL